MKTPKIEINQLQSPSGNTYLFMSFDDKNNHKSFEIYQLVQNQSEVAREFNIVDVRENFDSKLNTREMCEKIIEKFS